METSVIKFDLIIGFLTVKDNYHEIVFKILQEIQINNLKNVKIPTRALTRESSG